MIFSKLGVWSVYSFTSKIKVAFLEGRLFLSCQSELFESILNCSDWLMEAGTSNRPLLFIWSWKQAKYTFISTILYNFTRKIYIHEVHFFSKDNHSLNIRTKSQIFNLRTKCWV